MPRPNSRMTSVTVTARTGSAPATGLPPSAAVPLAVGPLPPEPDPVLSVTRIPQGPFPGSLSETVPPRRISNGPGKPGTWTVASRLPDRGQSRLTVR
jgi:hypothetical protein